LRCGWERTKRGEEEEEEEEEEETFAKS